MLEAVECVLEDEKYKESAKRIAARKILEVCGN